MVVQGQAARYTSQQAGRICIEVPSLPASAAKMARKEAAASTGLPSFLYLEAEEDRGGDKYPLSVLVSHWPL